MSSIFRLFSRDTLRQTAAAAKAADQPTRQEVAHRGSQWLTGRVALLVVALGTACSPKPSVFEIVDYREPGNAKRYGETFDEGYYDLDDHGNLTLVLRRHQPGDADRPAITQIIRVQSLWRPIPGRTVSHSTQINAKITYAIQSGRTGATFEGAGSIFYEENYAHDALTGTLDLATLRPKRQLASTGEPIFKRAELTGSFRATRDRRQVVRLVNETDRLFGPLPPHDAAPHH